MPNEAKLLIVGAGAVLVLAIIGYAAARKVGQVAAANVDLVNPLSTGNIVYRGVNATGAAISGDQSFSLGARLWELLNPGALARENAALAQTFNPLEGFYRAPGDPRGTIW